MKKLLWILSAIMMGTYICGPVRDPDLWWHIAVGKWILSKGHVPHLDYWNMFGVGKPWIAYSWIHEIVYAYADLHAGLVGLLLIQLGLAVLFSLSLFYFFGKTANSWFIGALLAFCALAASYNFFGLRPQVFSWILFAWILYLAEAASRTGVNKKIIFGVCAAMVLWANSHITTAFGIALLFLWQFDLTNFRYSIGRGLKLALPAFAATFITPYFGKEWIVFLTKADHPFANTVVVEFQPASIYHAGANIILLLSVLLAIFIHYRQRTLEPIKLLLCIIFVVGAMTVLKFIPFAAIFVAFLLVAIWGKQPDSVTAFGNISAGLGTLESKFQRLPVLATTAGAVIVLLCIFHNVTNLQRQMMDKVRRPVKAVDFVKAHKLPAPILNGFGDGGYLIYRFTDDNGEPSQLVPIDGRTNVNPPHIMKAFRDTLLTTSRWREFFDLVQPQTVVWGSDVGLRTLLKEVPEWCEVYSDVVPENPELGHSVFVKREFFEANKTTLQSPDCHS